MRIRRRSRDLRLAPRSRRVAAGLIDAPLMLSGVGAVIAAAGWGVKRAGADPGPRALSKRLPSKAVMRPILAFLSGLAVLLKLHRSPGQRLAGIRTVDANTGGPVSLRQAIVLVITPMVRDTLLRGLTRPLQPPDEPAEDQGRALEAVKRVHAGDQEAVRAATMAYYEEHRREWSFAKALARPLALAILTLLIEARVRRRWPGRSLGDVLAGTAIVVDR